MSHQEDPDMYAEVWPSTADSRALTGGRDTTYKAFVLVFRLQRFRVSASWFMVVQVSPYQRNAALSLGVRYYLPRPPQLP